VLSHNLFDVQSLITELCGSLKEIMKVISTYTSVFCGYVIRVEVSLISYSHNDEYEEYCLLGCNAYIFPFYMRPLPYQRKVND
jgi:hypothetical protein